MNRGPLLFSIPEEEDEDTENTTIPISTSYSDSPGGGGENSPVSASNVNRAFWDFVRRRKEAPADDSAQLEVVGVYDEGGTLWLLPDSHRRRSGSPQPTLSSLSLSSLASYSLAPDARDEEPFLVPTPPVPLDEFEESLSLPPVIDEGGDDRFGFGGPSRLSSSGSTILPPSLPISRAGSVPGKQTGDPTRNCDRGSIFAITHSRSVSAPSLSAYLRIPDGTYLEFDQQTGWWILLRRTGSPEASDSSRKVHLPSASMAAEFLDGDLSRLRAIRSLGNIPTMM
ncbi:hypothetical protein HDU93_000584 [Gonapodya sp. JEL0774]|nr:hypothetical protein HDU93_000584 [Gonapodya sp. JEL0774]